MACGLNTCKVIGRERTKYLLAWKTRNITLSKQEKAWRKKNKKTSLSACSLGQGPFLQ